MYYTIQSIPRHINILFEGSIKNFFNAKYIVYMYNFIKKIRPISAFNYLRYYFLRFVRETGKLFWLRTRYFEDDINSMEKKSADDFL